MNGADGDSIDREDDKSVHDDDDGHVEGTLPGLAAKIVKLCLG